MDIIRAEPDDFEQLVALFRAYDFALKERDWFDWKHVCNPFGDPHLYKLIENGELAGTIGLLAQPFTRDGRAITAIQAVDGLMGRGIRGKGLFNEVMAFIMNAASDTATGPSFATGFPALSSSKRAFEKAGWQRLAGFHVYKALLSPRALRHKTGGALLSRLLAPFWGPMRARLFRAADDDLEIVPVERFIEDLDRLQPKGRICGARSAAFLNWRVIDNPRDDMRAILFRRDGRTVGYAICKVQPNTWEVVEFRTEIPGPTMVSALLRYLYGQGLTDAVDFWLLDGFEQMDKLPAGLLERAARGVMFVNGLETADLPADPDQWAASYLDSDW